MCDNPTCPVLACRWERNRADNLRMLIRRYIRAGRADDARECTMRLVRLCFYGDETLD